MATRVTIYSINGPGVGITFPEDKQVCMDAMGVFFTSPDPVFHWEDVAKGLDYIVNKSEIFYVEYRTIS